MKSPSAVLLRTQSDARLVGLVRAGHDRAFEAIVERYRRPLLRACRRILPEARAEDALQQALVAAWTALRRGDDVLELRPWLYRIVRNTALNQLRVGGYDFDELVDTLGAADDPEQEVERRALVRQTLAAVAALPERQRDALLRSAIDGQGQDELARDLGLSNTAARQLVHRARVSVRTAATAVVPLPLAIWLASASARGDHPMAQRIVELVAGGSAAGASATLAKAGTVVVLAGSAAGAPALLDDPRPPKPPLQARATPRPTATATPRLTAPAKAVVAVATATPRSAETPWPGGGAKRSAPNRGPREDATVQHDGGERRGDDDGREDRRRGSEEDEGEDRRRSSGEDQREESGDGDERERRDEPDEGGQPERDGDERERDLPSSDPGSSGGDEPLATPAPTATPDEGEGDDEDDGGSVPPEED